MKLVSNKKGFTLIELLAVIVILAVIILIAASNIGGMTTKAKKNVLAIEGNTLVDAAKTAYQMDTLEGTINVTGSGEYCYSLEELVSNGYFEKSGDDYQGSVLISPIIGKNGYTYKFWISNKSYSFNGKDKSGVTEGATGNNADSNYTPASKDCNGKKSKSS